MLAPIKHLLKNKRVVLASGSPRRHEMMKMLGLEAELCPSTFEENLDPANYNDFSDYMEATALGKAEEVFQRLTADGGNGADLVIIAADTLVTLGKEIYGKPKDIPDAIRMLTNLSGKGHRVFTGVVLKHSQGVRKFTDTTDVYFGELTKDQIEDYVTTINVLDKAGAYGVQGMGGALIHRIDGDFYTVMGLPLHRLCCELNKLFLDELK